MQRALSRAPLRLVPSRIRFILSALLPFLAIPPTQAQNRNAATRSNDISAFVAFSGVTPAYFPGKAAGLTAGLDLSHHFNRLLTPTLEIRANRAGNDRLIERSVLFGPLLELNLHARIHPYADLLIGGGTIVFLDPTVGYHEDRSSVYSYGGGVTLDLTTHFAAKLDLQGQSWNIGKQALTEPDLTFSPKLLSFGLKYSIPFRPREARH